MSATVIFVDDIFFRSFRFRAQNFGLSRIADTCVQKANRMFKKRSDWHSFSSSQVKCVSEHSLCSSFLSAAGIFLRHCLLYFSMEIYVLAVSAVINFVCRWTERRYEQGDFQKF